jgi:hypothetical protein
VKDQTKSALCFWIPWAVSIGIMILLLWLYPHPRPAVHFQVETNAFDPNHTWLYTNDTGSDVVVRNVQQAGFNDAVTFGPSTASSHQPIVFSVNGVTWLELKLDTWSPGYNPSNTLIRSEFRIVPTGRDTDGFFTYKFESSPTP